MTPRYDPLFRESAAHYRQIGWSFVVGIALLTLAGIAAYATDSSGSMLPTLLRHDVVADTAVVDTLLVTRTPF
jgi:signal peptidase I